MIRHRHYCHVPLCCIYSTLPSHFGASLPPTPKLCPRKQRIQSSFTLQSLLWRRDRDLSKTPQLFDTPPQKVYCCSAWRAFGNGLGTGIERFSCCHPSSTEAKPHLLPLLRHLLPVFEGRSSSAGKWGFSSGVGGLPRIRVDIYALKQQEKLLVFSKYLAKIPNNSQNPF